MPILPMMMMMLAHPDAGPVKVFGDWAVGCDNLHRCEMTSLVPGDGAEAESGYGEISFSIVRDAGPAAGFSIEVQMSDTNDGSEVSVRVDDEVITGKMPKGGLIRFAGAEAGQIVAAMIRGKQMRITDIGDGTVGLVSLSGSSAALRFIDADQGRAGGVTAAVAKGSRPANAVPAATAAPVVRFVRPVGTPARITPALRKAMDADGECAGVYAGGEGDPPEVEAYALGGGKTLALLPCGSGAYNFSTIPFVIATGKPVPAPFDFQLLTSDGAESSPELINASFDSKTGQLSTYNKGRGVGDCGQAEDYVWDGARFRLVGAREMPECRGSMSWITTFRAVPRAQ